MNIIEAIMNRRSIRKFTGLPINSEELDTLLKAGFQAPSAHNYQPREYIVIKDKEILSKISEFHPYARMAMESGCAIVVCGDTEKQSNMGFLISDCSASIQNMLLAAHGLGLGAVWCGLHDVDILVDLTRRLLNLPQHILPVGIVVVGNKIDDKNPIDRYNGEKVHYNKW